MNEKGSLNLEADRKDLIGSLNIVQTGHSTQDGKFDGV